MLREDAFFEEAGTPLPVPVEDPFVTEATTSLPRERSFAAEAGTLLPFEDAFTAEAGRSPDCVDGVEFLGLWTRGGSTVGVLLLQEGRFESVSTFGGFERIFDGGVGVLVPLSNRQSNEATFPPAEPGVLPIKGRPSSSKPLAAASNRIRSWAVRTPFGRRSICKSNLSPNQTSNQIQAMGYKHNDLQLPNAALSLVVLVPAQVDKRPPFCEGAIATGSKGYCSFNQKAFTAFDDQKRMGGSLLKASLK